jgi:hypothetical protein
MCRPHRICMALYHAAQQRLPNRLGCALDGYGCLSVLQSSVSTPGTVPFHIEHLPGESPR